MTWECDSNRHMNVMHYMNKYENAGHSFNIDLGIAKMLHDKQETLGLVVAEQKIRYMKEAFEDDVLYIMSELIGVGNKSIKIQHHLYKALTDEHIGTMELVAVLFDKVGRKGVAIPDQIKKMLHDKMNNL